MISKTFLRSSIIYSIIGALPYVSGVILIPIFTSFLTPAQFGINVIYFSMMSLFQVIAGFSMESLIGVYYFDYKDNRQKLRELIGMIIIFSLTIGAALFLFSSVFGPMAFKFLWPKVENLEFFPYGALTILTAIFNAGFKFYSAMLISQQRPGRFLFLSTLNFTLTIGITIFLLYHFPFTLNGPIFGRLIPAAITFTISILMMNFEFGLAFNQEMIKPILSFCIPVFVYSMMIWIVNNIDRFIIQKYIPDSAYVGIYDIAVKVTLFVDLLQTGLANTINPKVFAIWKDGNHKSSTPEVNRYYNVFTAITILIIPLVVIAVPILVPIVIKKQIYYEALTYLPILTLGFATRGWFFMLSAPIYYFKKTKVLPRVFLFSAIFQIVCSVILIKYFGLMGAVWTNFLVKPIQTIFLYAESRKFFTYRINKWKIFYLPITYIFIVIVSEILSTEPYKIFIHSGQLLISFLLVFITYRNELTPTLKKMILR